jgi:hypothetical protein
MRKTPILTLALGAGLIAALAGCTTSSSNDSSKTPSPTVTAAAPVVNKCVDGEAVLTPTKDKPEITLTEACDTVSVVGTSGKITLGAVKHIVFEGNDNTVTVESIEKVDFGGNDNSLTHKGTAPAVNDKGTVGNSVKAG